MSLSLPFERLKRIDTKYKNAVSGYVRNVQTAEIPESIQLIILLFYYNIIDSSILTNEECDKLLSIFDQQNTLKNLGLYACKLLFKGTRDGFITTTFYTKCHKPHTFSIIHTPQNNVFGGYTSIAWKRTIGGKYETDPSAFIFRIRSNKNSNPKIFVPKDNGKKAIGQSKDWYLKFGYGGYAFMFNNRRGLASYKKCQEYDMDLHELNGVNQEFQPIEIEVFQLV